MFQPLLSSIIPEQIIMYLVLWGFGNIVYLILMSSVDDFNSSGGLLSTNIKDTYHDMTKIGLFIMKPLVFMIMILEFGGISLLVVYLMINLWFIPVGAMLITLFLALLHKLIYKDL